MTLDLDYLADRHFRSDPYGVLATPATARRPEVLIGIDAPMAGTKAGQDALWMLANLLCRQFRLVTGITLDIPSEIALLPRVAAFGEVSTLKDTVANCVRLVAGTHVDVGEFVGKSDKAYQIEIFVGSPPSARRAPVRLVLFADGWRLYLGNGLPPTTLPHSGLTFGPYLGACFAAGEVFKHLRGMKQGKGELIGEGRELFLSLWSTKAAFSWDQLDRDPEMECIDLPSLYFAGAGAVAEAAALSIAGLPNATGHASAVDPDALDLSNDNRYALATLDDANKPKAPLIADLFKRRGFGHYSYAGTWQDYVGRQGREPIRADLAEFESRFLFRLVLSCVDDNGARHAIQKSLAEDDHRRQRAWAHCQGDYL